MQNVAKAKLSHTRISARKVKIVIDLIRNKPVGTALAILKHTPKAACAPVEKLLLSAIANAENNHGMDPSLLIVSEIFADQGPTLKRIRARAQGRAFRINKRTSHITIAVKESEALLAKQDAAKKDKKATKKPATKKTETTTEEKAKKSPAKKKADSKVEVETAPTA